MLSASSQIQRAKHEIILQNHLSVIYSFISKYSDSHSVSRQLLLRVCVYSRDPQGREDYTIRAFNLHLYFSIMSIHIEFFPVFIFLYKSWKFYRLITNKLKTKAILGHALVFLTLSFEGLHILVNIFKQICLYSQ